jgi:hypothetical protein
MIVFDRGSEKHKRLDVRPEMLTSHTMYLRPIFANRVIVLGRFATAEQAAKEVLTLPTCAEPTSEQIRRAAAGKLGHSAVGELNS